jgi:hypothetical protein
MLNERRKKSEKRKERKKKKTTTYLTMSITKETKGGKEGGASLIFSDTITVLETF